MGHLTNIANNIVNQREKSEYLDKFLKDNLSAECLSKWDDFVNTELSKINKTHQILLVRLYSDIKFYSRSISSYDFRWLKFAGWKSSNIHDKFQ